jgi:hypothetical protein
MKESGVIEPNGDTGNGVTQNGRSSAAGAELTTRNPLDFIVRVAALPLQYLFVCSAEHFLPRHAEPFVEVAHVEDAALLAAAPELLGDALVDSATIREGCFATAARGYEATEEQLLRANVGVRVFVMKENSLVCGVFCGGVNSAFDGFPRGGAFSVLQWFTRKHTYHKLQSGGRQRVKMAK